MKVSRILKFTVAAVCAATIVTPSALRAAADGESETVKVYPDSFVCSLELTGALTDYAVYGENVAFACKNFIYTLAYNDIGDRERKDYRHDSQITNIDYDQRNGRLYFEASLTSYLLTYDRAAEDWSVTEAEHEFKRDEDKWQIVVDKTSSYILNDTGVLSYLVMGVPTVVEGTFKPYSLKTFGDVIYAVRESDRALCTLSQGSAERADVSYTDFTSTKSIPTAGFNLNAEDGNNAIETAIITGGDDVYCTRIDLNGTGAYFTAVKTIKVNAGDELSCLVLGTHGNAAIVVTKDGCFITAISNLSHAGVSELDNDWPVNDYGNRQAYAVDGVGVYASPYVSAGTLITNLKSGKDHPVTVCGKVPKTVTGTEFYRVTYRDGESTVTGFVPASFLTVYNFAAVEFEPVEKGDENFEYGTNVTSVILVIIIVGLVILAVLYLMLVCTGKPKKKKKPEKKQSKRRDDDEDED